MFPKGNLLEKLTCAGPYKTTLLILMLVLELLRGKDIILSSFSILLIIRDQKNGSFDQPRTLDLQITSKGVKVTEVLLDNSIV